MRLTTENSMHLTNDCSSGNISCFECLQPFVQRHASHPEGVSVCGSGYLTSSMATVTRPHLMHLQVRGSICCMAACAKWWHALRRKHASRRTTHACMHVRPRPGHHHLHGSTMEAKMGSLPHLWKMPNFNTPLGLKQRRQQQGASVSCDVITPTNAVRTCRPPPHLHHGQEGHQRSRPATHHSLLPARMCQRSSSHHACMHANFLQYNIYTSSATHALFPCHASQRCRGTFPFHPVGPA